MKILHMSPLPSSPPPLFFLPLFCLVPPPPLAMINKMQCLTLTGPVQFRNGPLQLLINVHQLFLNQWILHIQYGVPHIIVESYNHVQVLQILAVGLVLLEEVGCTCWQFMVCVFQLLQVFDITQEGNQLKKMKLYS